MAIGINKRKIVNKKIIINIERSADYIGLIWALWINGNTVIPTNKNWPKKYIKEAERLLPNNNYIGFSLTQGNVYRKKSWAIENFINVAKQIVNKNKTPVFFIEKDKFLLINRLKNEIPSALFPELNSEISSPVLVTALSTRLDKAISIDNGVMHMIGLAKIPMIVLFGPTDSEKFAPIGKRINILDSKKIYNSDNINTIKVEDVLNLI